MLTTRGSALIKNISLINFSSRSAHESFLNEFFSDVKAVFVISLQTTKNTPKIAVHMFEE